MRVIKETNLINKISVPIIIISRFTAKTAIYILITVLTLDKS